MKNLKKLFAFSMLLSLSFLKMYGSENKNSQDLEFPQHTTEKYIYDKSVETQKHDSLYITIFGKHPDGISITDKTSEDLLSNRVTRKKVEARTENGVSIVTTETWVSRNPSYVTWINGALVVSSIAAIVLGAASINALSNVGAAGVNAYGNIASGALTSNNPKVQQQLVDTIDYIAKGNQA